MVSAIIIMALGVILFKLSLMGNDPSTAMVIAIGDKVGVNFSIILLGMNLVWFIAELIWNRKLIGAGTFVNWFLVGPLASLYEKLITSVWQVPKTLWVRILLMAGGVLILSLSCAMYQTSDLGIAPYDAVSITISEKSGKKYFWCRILTDSVCVGVAFALGGIIGAGTLVCALGLGPFIQFFSKHIAEPLVYGGKHQTDKSVGI